MITNFESIFDKQKTGLKIPTAVLTEMSKDLPGDLRYEDVGNGQCSLFHDNVKIEGLRPKFNNEDKEKFRNKSGAEIIFYLWNSQKKYEFECEEAGYIVLNGEKIAINKLDKNAFKSFNYINEGKFYIKAVQPEPIELILSSEKGKCVHIMLNKVPCDSFDTVKYRTNNRSFIKFEFEIDIKNGRCNYAIGYMQDSVNSVEEMVNGLRIYNDFAQGKGLINGKKFPSMSDDPNVQVNDIVIEFWEKVLAIEKSLDLKFDISNTNIDDNLYNIIEMLFHNLVKKTPVRFTDTINSLNWNRKAGDEKKLDELIKNKFVLTFESKFDFDIFNQKISLPAINAVFDMNIIKFIDVKDDRKYIIDNSELKAYQCTMCFGSEDEKQQFNIREHMQEFKMADKKIYLQRN